MKCTSCGFENPEGMNFCGTCGSPLTRQCGACGSRNPPDFRFCGTCGSSLQQASAGSPAGTALPTTGAAPAAEGERVEPNTAVQGERRQITVMFCDLVGSTALSIALDPEELRELIRSYQTACAAAIESFGGYIAQYLGDGILAYFGYPTALENEACCAVRAGLRIVRDIEELNRTLTLPLDTELAVRVGVHTGVVVVGEVGGGMRREQLALGETPNLAARLQALAEPNSMALSAATRRLVAHEFDTAELGVQPIRGVAGKQPVYRIVGERAADRSGGLPQDSAATPLVGREQEIAVLLERWERATAGQGQVVLIGGDSGIGKSHLVRGFIGRLDAGEYTVLEGRCLPYYRNTAYYPIIDLLQRRLNCYPELEPEERLKALVSGLQSDGFSLPETIPLFSALLSIPLDTEVYPPYTYTAQQQKERTQAALLQLFLKAGEHRPLLLVVEDVHWADPSSLELLNLLPQVPSVKALVLLTHRPEFRMPWIPRDYFSYLSIERLEEAQTREIVDRLTGGKALPPEVLQEIVSKTDGVPLFVEELTKMVLESGLLEEREERFELAGPLPPLAIPSSLHDSLEVRLDRLAGSKALAQLGATIGREFSYSLLRAVCTMDEQLLRQSLAQLVDAEFVYQRGQPPNATYVFKHALIQEAAYQSLLRSMRQRYHQRIAGVLESGFPEVVKKEPEVLAQHYSAAGLHPPAIDYWLRAGQQALERFASHEVVAHLQQAETLLELLPDTPERMHRELTLLLIRGPALVATRGYTAPEIRSIYTRAMELSDTLGETTHRFQVQCGLFGSYFVRLELREAQHLAEQLLEAAEQDGDAAKKVAAYISMGVTLLEMGVLHRARENLQRGIDLYDPWRHSALAYLAGQDYAVAGLSYNAYALWALGHPDQAVQSVGKALDLARLLEHPNSIAFALACSASVHYFRREPEAVLRVTDELAALATREGFRHWLLHATVLGGWALTRLGRVEEGFTRLRQMRPEEERKPGEPQVSHYYRVLVEALLESDQPAEALRVLEEAQANRDRQHSSVWREADLHRLRGVVLGLTGGFEEEAEALLRHSLEVARSQGARMLELRALTSLGRLLNQGEQDPEVLSMLRSVYRRFTEGFDLPDLREARALLDGQAPITTATAG